MVGPEDATGYCRNDVHCSELADTEPDRSHKTINGHMEVFGSDLGHGDEGGTDVGESRV